MYETFQLTNYTLIGIDNQSYLTNLTIHVVTNSKEFWYESTLISTLLGVIAGVVMTFTVTIFQLQLKEKAELQRYEYNLLSITIDLLSKPLDEVKKDIEDFVDKIYPDLKFSKLETGNIILTALLKAKEGDNYSSEIQKIENRIKEIRKKAKKRF